MPSTTTYERGQVIVVNVPFTAQTGSKPRPAVIVSSDAFHAKLQDVIVCPISSQPRYYSTPGPGDHPIERWREAGLRHASTARLSNLVTVEKKLIKRALGTMADADLRRIDAGPRFAFGFAPLDRLTPPRRDTGRRRSAARLTRE